MTTSAAALRLSELDASSIGSVLKVQSAALAAGQSHVDILITFIRERTALEETHAKALQRLARTTLAFDGAFINKSAIYINNTCVGASYFLNSLPNSLTLLNNNNTIFRVCN